MKKIFGMWEMRDFLFYEYRIECDTLVQLREEAMKKGFLEDKNSGKFIEQ